jgi:hypothetical protein
VYVEVEEEDGCWCFWDDYVGNYRNYFGTLSIFFCFIIEF